MVTSLLSGLSVPAPGFRLRLLHLTHPNMCTEMTASRPCPSSKCLWVCSTAWGRGRSAKWSSCFLQKEASGWSFLEDVRLFSVYHLHGVHLFPAEPSEAPSDIRGRAASASEIVVFWEPVPSRSTNEIISYEVGQREQDLTPKQQAVNALRCCGHVGAADFSD